MFSDRRQARKARGADGAGEGHQLGVDTLVSIKMRTGLSGPPLYRWWVKFQPANPADALAIREGLEAGARARGVSVQEFVEERPQQADDAAPVIVEGSGKPHGPPVAKLHGLVVYERPPLFRAPTGSATHLVDHDISRATNATVDSAGGVAATRGRNLADKAWGTAATAVVGLGPLGALLFGNAKETVHDGRELYLNVVDPAWHYSVAVHPSFGQQTRELAMAINRVALGLAEHGGSGVLPASTTDKIGRLSELSALRRDGSITQEEFDELKRDLLGPTNNA